MHWKTQDVTDLDYTPRPLLRRDNTEKDFQFTQEIRLASADTASLQLADSARLRWQAGVFLFTQAYRQDAINSYAPRLFAPFPVSQHTPRSALDDFGLGVFGQGTVTFNDRLDLTAGTRLDYEDKSASLEHFYDPAIRPGTSVDADKSFSNVSPQVALAYRITPDKSLYATVGGGYKAGGFNSASPAGSEAYGEEHTWHFEGGAKTLWANGRISTNAALFYIDWDDLQLNVPNPAVVLAHRWPGDGPWPRRCGLLWRVPVQRREYHRAGRVLARQLPRGHHRTFPDRRGIRAERLRHAVYSARVPLPEFRADGFHGRDGRSAHGRRERRRALLNQDSWTPAPWLIEGQRLKARALG